MFEQTQLLKSATHNVDRRLCTCCILPALVGSLEHAAPSQPRQMLVPLLLASY